MDASSLDRTLFLPQTLMRTNTRGNEMRVNGRWQGAARALSGADEDPWEAAATTAAWVKGVEETLAGCSDGAWVLAGPNGAYPIIVVSSGVGFFLGCRAIIVISGEIVSA